MTLRKASKILVTGQRIALAHDIDVLGSKEVEYNVSREKIIGRGATFVRDEFRKAVVLGLRETGIWDRLSAYSQLLLNGSVTSIHGARKARKVRAALTDELLERVLNRLPLDPWPQGLHRIIASEFELPPRIVGQAITTLIDTGRVQHASSRHAEPQARRSQADNC